MRKNILILSALALVIAGCAVLSGAVPQGEVYTGTAQGYRGPITVQVRISNGSITEIVVAESSEDRFVGGDAIEQLIDIVIENNSTDVDVISGATISSKGFLEAVESARSQEQTHERQLVLE